MVVYCVCIDLSERMCVRERKMKHIKTLNIFLSIFIVINSWDTTCLPCGLVYIVYIFCSLFYLCENKNNSTNLIVYENKWLKYVNMLNPLFDHVRRL